MKQIVRAAARLVGLTCLMLVGSSQAQDVYPSKPIRIVVPSTAGSGTDAWVRSLSRYLGEKYGWQFVIDNKAGGNGFIAIAEFLRQPNDGYTLFAGGSSVLSSNPAQFKKLPYDPIGDFTPVGWGVSAPYVLIAAPKHKVRTAAELMDLLRKNPGKLSYGSSGANRNSAERFLQMAQLKALHVPYKANPPAITDLIGGHVDYMFVDTVISLPQIKGGALTPLAVTSARRLKQLPAVPTMMEIGFADFQMAAWNGLFLHKNAVPAHVTTLNKAILEYSAAAAGGDFMETAGGFTEMFNSAQITKRIEEEIGMLREVARRAGIEPE